VKLFRRRVRQSEAHLALLVFGVMVVPTLAVAPPNCDDQKSKKKMSDYHGVFRGTPQKQKSLSESSTMEKFRGYTQRT
jgi:hypothetical protein